MTAYTRALTYLEKVHAKRAAKHNPWPTGSGAITTKGAVMTDRSDAEQIALSASMAHHPAGGVDWSGFDEFLPPLVPMSSAVMADAQAEIAGTDRDYCPPVPIMAIRCPTCRQVQP